MLWRISLADITAECAFSQFTGMERTAILVQGNRLRLSNLGSELRWDGVGSCQQFPGEWALYCDKPEVPTQLLNIMVRRGSARLELDVIKDVGVALQPGGLQVLLVLSGEFQLETARGMRQMLAQRTGAYWLDQAETWYTEPLGSNAALLWCRLT